ncbi:MAG: hypothetical protein K6F50_06175 [Kiritimatiellae bacterium]|nr:hypothetical protein [Kiritimatiellia bacterium]
MKKLVSIALAGLSVAAGAAPEKLLEAIVTDQTTLVQHATKLGEMSGVPMIGMGAVGLLAMNPLAGDFGAMRPGADATVLVTLVGDPDLFDGTEESLEAFGKSVRYTILYPGSVSKADYLAAHTNAVDMGSVVKVDDVEFAAFSADGKWVATGNCEKGVGIALAKAGTVKLPGGETARVNVTGAGMSVLGKFIDMAVAEAKKEGEEMPPQLVQGLEAIRDIGTLSFAVRVSPEGLDFLGSAVMKPGSRFAACGDVAFSSDALAFAGNAFIAAASAPKAGSWDIAALIEGGAQVLEKHGIKTSGWLALNRAGDALNIVLDVKAFAAWIKENEDSLSVDEAALEKDVRELIVSKYLPVDKAQAISFTFKDASSASSASLRFAKAFPSMKSADCNSAGVCSLYGMLLAIGGEVAALAESEEATVRNMLAALPPAGDGCIAYAAWKKNGVNEGIVRVTPEELKGYGTIAMSVVSGISGSMRGAGMPFEAEELDDDEPDTEDGEDAE